MRVIVPGEGVVRRRPNSDSAPFESDGLTALPATAAGRGPDPRSTGAGFAPILKYCSDQQHPESCRAASGTSLSGGAWPLEDAVVLVMSLFNRITRHRLRQPRRSLRSRRDQSRHHQGVEEEGFYYAN